MLSRHRPCDARVLLGAGALGSCHASTSDPALLAAVLDYLAPREPIMGDPAGLLKSADEFLVSGAGLGDDRPGFTGLG